MKKETFWEVGKTQLLLRGIVPIAHIQVVNYVLQKGVEICSCSYFYCMVAVCILYTVVCTICVLGCLNYCILQCTVSMCNRVSQILYTVVCTICALGCLKYCILQCAVNVYQGVSNTVYCSVHYMCIRVSQIQIFYFPINLINN